VADNDDWRVTITIGDPAHLQQAHHAFSIRTVEADVRARLGGHVALGANEAQIFLYAGSAIAAREAERLARQVLADDDIPANFALHRWHPIEEEWEAPDMALPGTGEEEQAEHQHLMDSETMASLTSGIAQWEAKAEFPSHREAAALAAKLSSEGLPVARRWRFLVVFANNEDDARAAADRIRAEAPPDATISVEPAPGQAQGAALPFADFNPSRVLRPTGEWQSAPRSGQ
jgi:hypothetical protein